MASLELPHWLMAAGALFVVGGFIGLTVTRRTRAAEIDRDRLADELIGTTRTPMPPLPALPDSTPKRKT